MVSLYLFEKNSGREKKIRKFQTCLIFGLGFCVNISKSLARDSSTKVLSGAIFMVPNFFRRCKTEYYSRGAKGLTCTIIWDITMTEPLEVWNNSIQFSLYLVLDMTKGDFQPKLSTSGDFIWNFKGQIQVRKFLKQLWNSGIAGKFPCQRKYYLIVRMNRRTL